MDFTTVKEYLVGSAFSNALKLQISKTEKRIPYRLEVIGSIVESKNIIHFGCTDHIEMIEDKIAKNIWLHNLLLAKAASCIGIDNNKTAIDYVRNKLKIPDVYCLDIEKENIPSQISASHFDFIVLGEIIEHVDNPVQFLESFHAKFKGIVDQIIITAPNAFRWNNFKYAFKHIELINSDHRYWFTPYTLAKVLNRAGYNDIRFKLIENARPGWFSLRKNFIFRCFPAFRDTILIQARFSAFHTS